MNAPRRWIEDERSEAGALLRGTVELETPSIEARRRVARKLQTSRGATSAPVPMLRFALAGVVTALAIVAVIRVLGSNDPQEPPPSWAQLTEVQGDVRWEASEGEGDLRAHVIAQRSSSARISAGPKTSLQIVAESELLLSELEGAPVIDVLRGTAIVDARTITGVRAGSWRVRTAAARFSIERRAPDLVFIEAQSGEVTVEGPRRMVLKAGEKFSSGEEEEKSRPLLVQAEEKPRRTPQPAPAKIEESDERLYQRARDAELPAEAIALYDRAAAMRGPYAEIAAYQAARANMKRASFTEAIARFERFLDAHANSAYAQEAGLDLIECRIQTGDLDRARRDLEIFLERHPNSERASELRRLRDQLSARGEKK